MSRFIYADHAATTALSDTALRAMTPYFQQQYGNPSSLYRFAQEAKSDLEQARAEIAACLGAKPEEIYFTSGGTEADNWALKGVAELRQKKGKHIITTAIEHHAVLHTAQWLEKQGYEVTYVPVDSEGRVDPAAVKAAIRPDTILISVMAANNEIGTVEPIAEIGAIAREAGVLFHTDAVQAVGHLPVNVVEQNIDLLSLSAHKFHGPKGVGALYARKGVALTSLIEGGAQERGKRAGTEDLPAIAGMAAALQDAVREMDANTAKVSALRDQLIEGLSAIPHSTLTGDREHRLPGCASFCFEGIEGESLLLLLDQKGVGASSGSACTSGSLDPSHVLLAIGLPHEVAHGSLRLTLSHENTPEEMEHIIQAVTDVVAYLRSISPVWNDLQKGIKNYVIQ